MIKNRNMFAQVLLMVVTLGVYAIYWFYQTAKELKDITKDETAQPTLWTILLFIPFINLFAIYKYCELFEKASSEKLNMWILFILWFAFHPAVWFVVQMDLNNKATALIAGQARTV